MEKPVGRQLHYVARAVQRSFDQALQEAGGSLSMWLVLLVARRGEYSTQQDLARAAGIEAATLTHHLDSMEAAGLVVRSREPADRRALRVMLTDQGEALYGRLEAAATRFDQHLRRDVQPEDLAVFRRVLEVIGENVRPGCSDL